MWDRFNHHIVMWQVCHRGSCINLTGSLLISFTSEFLSFREVIMSWVDMMFLCEHICGYIAVGHIWQSFLLWLVIQSRPWRHLLGQSWSTDGRMFVLSPCRMEVCFKKWWIWIIIARKELNTCLFFWTPSQLICVVHNGFITMPH